MNFARRDYGNNGMVLLLLFSTKFKDIIILVTYIFTHFSILKNFYKMYFYIQSSKF